MYADHKQNPNWSFLPVLDHLKKSDIQGSCNLWPAQEILWLGVFHKVCSTVTVLLCYKFLSVSLFKHLGFFYTSPISHPHNTLKTWSHNCSLTTCVISKTGSLEKYICPYKRALQCFRASFKLIFQCDSLWQNYCPKFANISPGTWVTSLCNCCLCCMCVSPKREKKKNKKVAIFCSFLAYVIKLPSNITDICLSHPLCTFPLYTVMAPAVAYNI